MSRYFHFGHTPFREYIGSLKAFNAVDLKPLYHCKDGASGNIMKGDKTRIDEARKRVLGKNEKYRVWVFVCVVV